MQDAVSLRALLVAGTLLASAPAQATDLSGLVYGLTGAGLLLAVGGGTLAAVGLGITLRRPFPDGGWIVAGYVAGGVNVGWGGFLLWYGLDNHDDRVLLALGGASLALAAIDIALATAALVKRQRWRPGAPPRVLLEPMMVSDASGRLAVGICGRTWLW